MKKMRNIGTIKTIQMGNQQKIPKLKSLISSEDVMLHDRLMKLRNRFTILVFLEETGVLWAETAIDSTNTSYWTPDLYIDCYETWNN